MMKAVIRCQSAAGRARTSMTSVSEMARAGAAAEAGVSTHGVEAKEGGGTGSTRGVRVGAGGGGSVHGVNAGVESGSPRRGTAAPAAFVEASDLASAGAVRISSAVIRSAIPGETEGRPDDSGVRGSDVGGALTSSAIVGKSGDGPREVGARVAGADVGAAGGAGLGSSENRAVGEVTGALVELGARGVVGAAVAVGRGAAAELGVGSGLIAVDGAAAGMDGVEGERGALGAAPDAGAAARMEESETARGAPGTAAVGAAAAGADGLETER